MFRSFRQRRVPKGYSWPREYDCPSALLRWGIGHVQTLAGIFLRASHIHQWEISLEMRKHIVPKGSD